MNQSATIRAFIAANPGATVATIRAATGIRTETVSNACKKMARYGLLVSTPIEGVYNRCTYVTGRELLIDRTERAHIANRTKAAARRSAAQQPSVGQMRVRLSMTDCVRKDTQAAYGATPDTEAWLAAGGHKQIIASTMQPYTRFPLYRGGFA